MDGLVLNAIPQLEALVRRSIITKEFCLIFRKPRLATLTWP